MAASPKCALHGIAGTPCKHIVSCMLCQQLEMHGMQARQDARKRQSGGSVPEDDFMDHPTRKEARQGGYHAPCGGQRRSHLGVMYKPACSQDQLGSAAGACALADYAHACEYASACNDHSRGLTHAWASAGSMQGQCSVADTCACMQAQKAAWPYCQGPDLLGSGHKSGSAMLPGSDLLRLGHRSNAHACTAGRTAMLPRA